MRRTRCQVGGTDPVLRCDLVDGRGSPLSGQQSDRQKWTRWRMSALTIALVLSTRASASTTCDSAERPHGTRGSGPARAKGRAVRLKRDGGMRLRSGRVTLRFGASYCLAARTRRVGTMSTIQIGRARTMSWPTGLAAGGVGSRSTWTRMKRGLRVERTSPVRATAEASGSSPFPTRSSLARDPSPSPPCSTLDQTGRFLR